jgi:hypothetical protein
MAVTRGTVHIWRNEIITPQEFIERDLGLEVIFDRVKAWHIDDTPIPARDDPAFQYWVLANIDGNPVTHVISDIQRNGDTYLIECKPRGTIMVNGNAIIFVQILTNKPKEEAE